MRLFVLILAFVAAGVQAHTVPSLTVEAVFQADHSYTLRINVDPRLFLSTQPTTLPPVEAKWYRDQSPDELKKSEQQAADYLKKALALLFSGKRAEFSNITFTPMDGATNMALGADSKEVHFLAEIRGTATGTDSQIVISKEANTSVILLNSLGDEIERRPQVLFPGETSRAFALEAKK